MDFNFLQFFVGHTQELLIIIFGVIVIYFIKQGLPIILAKKNEKIMEKLESNDFKLNTLIEHDKEQDKAIMGLTLQSDRKQIMNDSLPVSERLFQYRRYIKNNGNGEIKSFVEENLIPENRELWNGIVANLGL